MASSSNYRIIDNQFIYLKDGTRLSARIWLPEEADENNKVPAVLEYLPYRKRDITTYRDEITYAHFAMKGYAGVRVDMRGCGDSTGTIQDEYVACEQADAVEVIQWIAKQPWCTGKIGMMGISWGGFNSLQLAFEQPEPLKAIISICFADDRYSDDIHFKGGAMLMDNLRWGASMEIRNSLPPDPLISDDWKGLWLSRLKTTPPLLENWLSHPLRDSYWKHGSISEDYDRITAAAFLIGGYADGYTNTVERTLNNIKSPKRAIVGPWVHLYPHISAPAPLWGFCTEAVKWWDQHLKGIQAPEPPRMISFIQDRVAVPCTDEVKGRWVTDPYSEMFTYFMANGKLNNIAGTEKVNVCTPETCGQMAGTFFPTNISEMPLEQSADDEVCCNFETASCIEPYEILGKPVVTLSVASDKPVANIYIRLCIIDPEGRSRLIAFNAQNLNHDDKHEQVTKLNAGEFKDISIELDYIGEKISAGYKLRVCLSSSYFPMFLPNPEHTTLTVDLSKCMLQIPVLKDWKELPYKIPAVTNCRPKEYRMHKPSKSYQTIEKDQKGKISRTVYTSVNKTFVEHGLSTEWNTEQIESVCPEDPSTVELYLQHEIEWLRGDDWKVNVHYSLKFTADKDFLYTCQNRIAKHNNEIVHHSSNNAKHPRIGI